MNIGLLLVVYSLSYMAPTGASEGKLLSIAELNDAPRISDGTRVQGFVRRSWNCPACPKGAVCEACVRPHIILSQKPRADRVGPELGPDETVIGFVRPPRPDIPAGARLELVLEANPEPLKKAPRGFLDVFNRQVMAREWKRLDSR